MIENVNSLSSNTTNQMNISSSSQTNETQNSSQSQQDETKSLSNTISPAYSVEISKEGADLNSQSSVSASNAAQPSSTNKSSTTTSASSSSSSTENLSQYTDFQLQQMLNAGKISQSEYNTEITKRQARETAASNNAKSASDVSKSV